MERFVEIVNNHPEVKKWKSFKVYLTQFKPEQITQLAQSVDSNIFSVPSVCIGLARELTQLGGCFLKQKENLQTSYIGSLREPMVEALTDYASWLVEVSSAILWVSDSLLEVRCAYDEAVERLVSLSVINANRNLVLQLMVWWFLGVVATLP